MPLVLHKHRVQGCLDPIHVLLSLWEIDGKHDILVAPNGGLRLNAATQAALAQSGMSRAADLRSTPHGRGAAVDVWPTSFLAHVPERDGGTAKRWTSWEALPVGVKADFLVFGEFAEARGFKWGGRWRNAMFPYGDQPHVEILAWQSLPYPPKTRA
jgi:hypothetical protein